MYRKWLASVLLILFLTGSTGFQFITHTCTHSGTRYYSSFGSPDHSCEDKSTTETTAEDCCHKEPAPVSETKSCCNKNTTSTEAAGNIVPAGHSHNCCTDEARYFRVNTFSKAGSYAGLPVMHPQEMPQQPGLQQIISSFSSLFSAWQPHPPEHQSKAVQSLLCVFRI